MQATSPKVESVTRVWRNLKPRIGISTCVLGENVRYDGGHKYDSLVVETLSPFVEWVSVCPEVEAGMGVPREPVRLVGTPSRPRMVGTESGQDWTETMLAAARERSEKLRAMNLSGYILKKNSPSCGLERVRVYTQGGMPRWQGRGLYAQVLAERFPCLPLEEEGRLHDIRLRENFIERVFAYHRWQALRAIRISGRALIDFHTRHKLLLLAHSEVHLRRLGQIVGKAGRGKLPQVVEQYGTLFMEALAVPSTMQKHVNVLQHMLGYISPHLTSEERAEFLEIVRDYRHKYAPLVVPLTLMRHYVRKYRVHYLQEQEYLQPDCRELLLRNHA